MADVNFSNPSSDPDSRPAAGRSPAARSGDLRWDIIELLFFAYRDFVGDADHQLEAFGFGRRCVRGFAARQVRPPRPTQVAETDRGAGRGTREGKEKTGPRAEPFPERPPHPAADAPLLLLVDEGRRIRDLLSRFLCGEGY